jgi:hypothetical protein
MQLGPVSCLPLKTIARTPMNVSTGLARPGRRKSARFSFRWHARGLKPPSVLTPKSDHLISRLAIRTFLKRLNEKRSFVGSDFLAAERLRPGRSLIGQLDANPLPACPFNLVIIFAHQFDCIALPHTHPSVTRAPASVSGRFVIHDRNAKLWYPVAIIILVIH